MRAPPRRRGAAALRRHRGEGSLVLFQPEAGTVYAERALRAFARGLRIEEGRRIESLADVPEPAVVVTAGPWARRLLAGAGIDLPVVETRETVAYFRLEGEVPSSSPRSSRAATASTRWPTRSTG